MTRRLMMIAIFAGVLAGSVVIDRIAVIVGKHAIKTSDINRDLAVTQFLNGERPDSSTAAKHKAAERLIDQTIIRNEIEQGDWEGASQHDVDGMLNQVRQERFGGSAARLNQELARYGLTQPQLRLELQWQLDVLKFIDQRFRPGVLVTDDEVRAYYNQHRAELQRAYPQSKTWEVLEPKIRASLEGEKLNQNFEQWLDQARKQNRIEYRQGALE